MRFGVFIYDDAEPIDLATYGVLSMARRIRPEIEICTIAPTADIVKFSNGLRVVPDYDVCTAPRLDVLIVTGGPGWKIQSTMYSVTEYIRQVVPDTMLVSVCTGALILAASGVLDGKSATTKREVIPPETPPVQVMRAAFPLINVLETSVVDDKGVITGGGVTLCLDTMLYLLQKLFGHDMAAATAKSIEYKTAWHANLQQLPHLAPGVN